MAIPEKPLGGTELMMAEMRSRVDPALLDNVSVFNYIGDADFNKKTVYWCQLSDDQQAVQFLRDPDIAARIDQFVFVSHWQSERFRKAFGIPGYKTRVIRNAAAEMPAPDPSGRSGKVRVCHLSTPWRGLDVLLAAWRTLNPTDAELHVFSSTKIYGTDYHSVFDHQYAALYEAARSIPGVVYRDYTPNEDLRAELPTFDIMAYPCTFEETSCIAAIESLSAGLRVLCSNLGALPETTEGWADIYTFRPNNETHAKHFAEALGSAIREARDRHVIDNLATQATVYGPRWSWRERAQEWSDLLSEVAAVARADERIRVWDETIRQEVFVENEYDVPALSADDVVVDVGAHKGSFALRCLENGAGQVVCVEPSEENFQELTRALSGIDRATLMRKAAWSRTGLNISFSTRVALEPHNTGMATAFTESGDARADTIALDDILSEFERVRILKVDAEGAEYPALMSSRLLGRVDEIVGEVHDITPANHLARPLSYRRDCSKEALVAHLESFGFEVTLEQAKWPHNHKLTARKTNPTQSL